MAKLELLKTLSVILILASCLTAQAQTKKKITDLPPDISPTSDDIIEVTDQPGGTPTSKRVTLGNLVQALPAAGAANSGLMSTGSQSFSGQKTFGTGPVICTFGVRISGGFTLLNGPNGIEVTNGTSGVYRDIYVNQLETNGETNMFYHPDTKLRFDASLGPAGDSFIINRDSTNNKFIIGKDDLPGVFRDVITINEFATTQIETQDHDAVVLKVKGGSGQTEPLQQWFHDSTERATLTKDGDLSLDGDITQVSGITTDGIISTLILTVNDAGLSSADSRFEGDNDANLLYIDTTNDRVGVGTNTPATKLDVNGTVTANNIDTGNGAVELAGGSYEPTLTHISNVSASTVYECFYTRVGTTVTVSGSVGVDPTNATTLTVIGISLPIASNLTTANKCAGSGATHEVTGYAGAFDADATNDRAQLNFTTGSDTAERKWGFTFSYTIN